MNRYYDEIRREIEAVKRETSLIHAPQPDPDDDCKKTIVVSFKVDREFYEQYLAELPNKSEFIRLAIKYFYPLYLAYKKEMGWMRRLKKRYVNIDVGGGDERG